MYRPASSLLVVLVTTLVAHSRGHVLSTAQGRLRAVSNHGYTSYLGVPYADTTALDTRFKRAGAAPSWPGVREPQRCAARAGCPWADVHVGGAEADGGQRPVLVWAGGRGPYRPDVLLAQGIIVVHLYYRTGPLGFLCMDEERIPGNAGAKDLVLALRWVQDNIVAFNGSPSKVVVAGQGFGAALVEALLLSPMSRSLFHGAIIQSGSVLSPWFFNYDAKERAKKLAQMFTDSKDTDNRVSALLEADEEDLFNKALTLDVPYFPFGMCEEKRFKHEERFISAKPIDLLTNKTVTRVPLIIGYNSDEAYIFASSLHQAKFDKKIAKDLSILLPTELVFWSENEKKQAIKQIKELYFNKNFTMSSLLTYYRDAHFTHHSDRSGRHHRDGNHLPVYMYRLSHAGAPGVRPVPGVPKTGAAHSDELAYLFPDRGAPLQGDDGVVQEKLVKLWTNFVKYLNPTPPSSGLPPWEPTSSNLRVYDIGLEPQMRDFPHAKYMQFWEELYDQYYYRRPRDAASLV